MSLESVESSGLAAAARDPGGALRVCSRCVMDTTHSGITFDAEGVCGFCHNFEALTRNPLSPAEAKRRLDESLRTMKEAGRGHDYDCVLGLSGGVDSSFLAYQLKQWGVRPLAVQFDNGWNSELAVKNIEQICRKLKIDLFTYVVDWEEFRELQLAFFKASVVNIEIPSDHGIFAAIYQTAIQRGIRHLVSGVNTATEATVGIKDYGYYYGDLKHLRAIHRRFSRVPLKTFPQMSYFRRQFYERSGRIIRLDPLNLMDYNKGRAIEILKEEVGWRDYGGKHFESVITRFFQAYILPQKFGLDKRKMHLSNLIWSGQVTREAALEELARPSCPPEMLRQDREFVIKKFRITEAEFEQIMATPPKSYKEYPNSEAFWKTVSAVRASLRRGKVARTGS